MCGIAGYANLGASPGLFRERLDQAVRKMAHRGPDGSDQWFSNFSTGEIGLGHARLSIIDLTNRAKQPMRSVSGRYTLTYNGEIYNYVELRKELKDLGVTFTSDSDTEVLLAAWEMWGTDSLPKLNGMFAFAIYDSKNRAIVLARDRHGMKPLYFAKNSDYAVFGSETPLVARLLGKAAPNQQKVYEYLTMGLYDLDEQTFFDGVCALEPGHIATIKESNGALDFSLQRWSKTLPPEPLEIDFDSATNTVRELFLESIDLHLRSDVPLAVALSGGVDSSGIAGAVRHLYPDREIHTFSYGSPGFEKDESSWAKLVSENLNTSHHHVEFSAEEAVASFRRVVREQGEPTNSSSVIAQSQLYKAVSGFGFKVLLDGQGADELFAGYGGYIEFRLRSLLSERRYIDAFQLLKNWKRWAPQHSLGTAIPMLAATYVSGRLAGHGARFMGRGAFPRWINRKALSRNGIVAGVPETIEGYPVSSAPYSRFLQQHLFKSQSGGDLRRLLRHGDRSSMAHSVESRLPYLGTGLVDFTNSLPEPYLLARSGETKRVLRSALEGMVPSEVLRRRDKVGFETPEVEWLNRQHSGLDIARSPLGVFDWLHSAKLLADAKSSRTGPLWRVLNLSLWMEEFL